MDPLKKISTLMVCLLAITSTTPLQAQSTIHLNTLRVRHASSAGQEFLCAHPYSIVECESQIALLQAALRKYDTRSLRNWTWILVHSEDWRQITSLLHLNPSSPAFSHLEQHRTFLDEALLVLKPKRQLELMERWNLTVDKLLDLTVTHELGHALCQEADETKAEHFAERLRKSLPNICDTMKQQNLLAETR